MSNGPIYLCGHDVRNPHLTPEAAAQLVCTDCLRSDRLANSLERIADALELLASLKRDEVYP